MTKLEKYLNEIESKLCDSEVRVYDKENETFFTIKNNVKDIETLLKIVRAYSLTEGCENCMDAWCEIESILEERSK